MKTFVKILEQTGNLETEAKRFITVYQKNNEITLKQDILPKIFKSTGQIDRTIFASYETRAMNYFASLGSFRFLYLLATQDADATGQLKTISHIVRKTNLSS